VPKVPAARAQRLCARGRLAPDAEGIGRRNAQPAASLPQGAEMSAPHGSAVHRIVAGVDGSPPSINALRWAVRQAELTGGTVDAVTAWEFPLAAGGLGWAPVSPPDDTDYAELAAKALAAAVGEASPPPGVTVHQVVVAGNPARVLLDAARDADLLVVGNRGHSGFADALIGSVSVRCLHHAVCPVVIVRSPTRH
jgi:nucleotide-binding universal stress UspA family protein